jgi:hypothetical protein
MNHTCVTTISGGDPTLKTLAKTSGCAERVEISAFAQVGALIGAATLGVSYGDADHKG